MNNPENDDNYKDCPKCSCPMAWHNIGCPKEGAVFITDDPTIVNIERILDEGFVTPPQGLSREELREWLLNYGKEEK